MKLVIVHHHLNPGGVTRIIASQIDALKTSYPDIEIKLIVGATHEGFKSDDSSVLLNIFEPLNYLTDISDEVELRVQYATIYEYLKSEIEQDSVIHVHNLNLGKNPLVTLAFYQLAKDGYKILNHAHDFAEDRPDNWDFLSEVILKLFKKNIGSVLYPKLPNYMIGVLNSFDYERLEKKNFDKKRLYLIPNPVSMSGNKEFKTSTTIRKNISETLGLDNKKQIITYPVRVIGRKNIGEYILLSTLFNDQANWLVTQPPKNPKEVIAYNEWKKFCTDHKLDIFFEVGEKVGFEDLIASTDICFTTSLREGFGMTYMEPWIMNTPVVGRNLKYITKDLTARGIKFPYLYDALIIEGKDFIEYSVPDQMNIIANCVEKSLYSAKILADNKHLLNIFTPVQKELIDHNKNIIRTGFSLHKYAEELYEIYERLVG